jgi:capsular exopolysaccharide synthesis family protein
MEASNLAALNRAGPTEAAINHVVVWRMVRKHWAIALSTAAIIVVAVIFHTLGQKRIYQASATIQFDPHPPRPLGSNVEAVVELGAGSFWDVRDYYETQYKIIQSRRVSKAVVADLGLQHDAGFVLDLSPGEQPAEPFEALSEDMAATLLMSRLSVEPIKDSRLAVVRLEDANPERAQRVLNALLDTYITQNLEDARSATNSAADWLRAQVDKLKGQLESSEMALHDYKENKNILSVAFDDQSNMLRSEMQQLNEALTDVRTKREEIAARRAQLAKVAANDPNDLPASELLQSSLLQDLRRGYEDAVRDRDALKGAGKGVNHPEVLAADARVEATKSALLAEVRNIQGALDADLSIIQRQEGGLAGLFEQAKKQALELNLLEIEYNRLRRTKDNTEKLYSIVLERSKESDLAMMLRENNIRVVDRPLLPDYPIRPNVPVSVGLGVLFGLLVGGSFALALGLLDRSVKTPEDVEAELGLTCLGLLPEHEDSVLSRGRKRARRRGAPKPGGAPELVVHEDPTSAIAEAARTIRTNLVFMSPDHPYRTLLVTSAAPSEGKTTVACYIAVAMAQAGQRVLLIDCDLRRPRIHRVFGKTSEVGVTTALVEQNIDRSVHETIVPNLSILPAGPSAPNPAEIFHSESFKNLVKQAQERYDRVIIDSSPLMAVTDAAIVSTLVDGTVVVVRAFRTTKEVSRHAIRSLLDVGSKVAGAVLNAVNFHRHEYKYAYYYYKREGYYGREMDAGQGGTRGAPTSRREPSSEDASPPQPH